MDSEANELTHDEIWDDSALVNSWNQALEEYKKYHSIHAKGADGDLDLPAQGSQPDAETETHHVGQPPARGPAEVLEPGAETGTGGEGSTDAGAEEAGDTAAPGDGQGASGGLGLPTVLGSVAVRDEGLKKLLMSWYYAGYYTGLYEGQQQARQPE